MKHGPFFPFSMFVKKLTYICFTCLSILSEPPPPPPPKKQQKTKNQPINPTKQSVTWAKHSMCKKSSLFQFVYFKYARAHLPCSLNMLGIFVIRSVIIVIKNHHLISLSGLCKKLRNQSEIAKKLICLPSYTGKLIKHTQKRWILYIYVYFLAGDVKSLTSLRAKKPCTYL